MPIVESVHPSLEEALDQMQGSEMESEADEPLVRVLHEMELGEISDGNLSEIDPSDVTLDLDVRSLRKVKVDVVRGQNESN